MIRILPQINYNLRFFSENPLFYWKNPNFERFEKSYYFSRIVRQIWYTLMGKKFDIQTREQPMLVPLRKLK